MNDSLRLHIQRITKLPTLPAIAQEILYIANDESSSISELESIINKDPSITAKVLSISNSAFYRSLSQITDIRTAIVRIGFDIVKNIALGISLMTLLCDKKGPQVMDYKRTFTHSLAVGMISTLFSNRLDRSISGEVFTSGLLHDIGFLVLNKFFSDIYIRVIDELQKDIPLLHAEKNVLKFTHADIGAWLAEKWVLPDTITDVILYHHTPALAKRHIKNISIVHLADIVVTKKFYSVTEKEPLYPFDYSILEILGITEDDVEDMESELDNTIFSDEIFK